MTSGLPSKISEPERSSHRESLHSRGVFSASYLFVFSRWRVSFFIFVPLHIWRSFYLPAFLCWCISLEKQDVNSADRRQKYASSSSQISFIFIQKAGAQMAAPLFRSVRPGASADSDTEMPLTEWFSGPLTPADKLLIVATVNVVSTDLFNRVPQKMSFVRMWRVRGKKESYLPRVILCEAGEGEKGILV